MRLAAILMLACLAACGGDGRKDTPPATRNDAPLAGRDCTRAEGDSATAVCLALNQVERIGGSRSEVSRFLRLGDTTCVETVPAEANTLDGGGAVQLVRGGVVWAEVKDSTGCAGGRPPAPPIPWIRMPTERERSP